MSQFTNPLIVFVISEVWSTGSDRQVQKYLLQPLQVWKLLLFKKRSEWIVIHHKKNVVHTGQRNIAQNCGTNTVWRSMVEWIWGYGYLAKDIAALNDKIPSVTLKSLSHTHTRTTLITLLSFKIDLYYCMNRHKKSEYRQQNDICCTPGKRKQRKWRI